MKAFNPQWTTLEHRRARPFEPDFNNLLAILERKVPKRPTLFEFFLNEALYEDLTGQKSPKDPLDHTRFLIKAFKTAGYDYTTLHGSDFGFKSAQHMEAGKKTVSQNHDGLISDRASFERYPWPDPDAYDYSRLEDAAKDLPKGMKFVVYGPGGVLENVIMILGYEDLCFMMADDMPLVEDIFEAVGSRLVRYYEHCAPHNGIGALISNDDWGFATQTMLSTPMMKKLVVPWHKEIAKVIHASGKPAILHSCGQLRDVMEDVIDTIGYEGKHSYEDKIFPVEEAYEAWHSRIAILGGLDLDFVIRSDLEAVWQRGVNMLERSAGRGGYGLGSGNSIPYYVPVANYLAMISAVEAYG